MKKKEFVIPRSAIPPCPECGGRRVSTEVQIKLSSLVGERSSSYLVRLEQPARKTNWLNNKTNQSDLRARTCLECGYTSLYAVHLADLVPDE